MIHWHFKPTMWKEVTPLSKRSIIKQNLRHDNLGCRKRSLIYALKINVWWRNLCNMVVFNVNVQTHLNNVEEHNSLPLF